jgi:hypothetical protein
LEHHLELAFAEDDEAECFFVRDFDRLFEAQAVDPKGKARLDGRHDEVGGEARHGLGYCILSSE